MGVLMLMTCVTCEGLMLAVATCCTTAGWQTQVGLCRGSVLGASLLLLLLLRRFGCISSVGKAGRMGRGISIELQHGEGAHTICGLLEGLAGGGGVVILTVGGIN